MKKSNIILLVITIVIVIICFSGFSTYNGLVDKQETATTALADVQATYQRRADLIPNLAKTVQAYAKHEKETFEAVTKARASVGQIKLDAGSLTPEKMKQFEQAQGQLSEALGKLMVVAERYPELKANENFHSLQIQLEGTENRINEARQKYNAAVQDYNQSVRRFPNVIFAGMFGFNRMEKFEAAAGAEKAPELNFN
jgi:LemA protein